ncbi:MAG: hypothetical protein LBL36_00210 [Clostridiales Family XIII bacterium]|jgi:hypothetical protein|nr:hypothetical protein [Clostridiales Family XIII bacterium]
MFRQKIFITYWALAALLVPGAAYAYIDPATTTYIIQIITAIVITLGVTLGVLLYRMRMIVMKAKAHVLRLRVRFSPAKNPANSAGADAETGTERTESEDAAPQHAIPVRENFPAVVSAEEYVAQEPLAASEAKQAGTGKRFARDDRKFTRRALSVLPLSFALSFSFIIFSCFDLYVSNYGDMPFTLKEITPVILLTGAAAFLVVAGVLMMFKGVILDVLMSCAFAVLLAGYLQSTFLNKGMGQLTGDVARWGQDHTGRVLLNAAIWIAVLLAVFALRYFRRGAWRKLCVLLPLALVVIQSVALVSALSGVNNTATGYTQTEAKHNKALSYDGIYDVGSKKNTIIFLLDKLDANYIRDVRKTDPHFFDKLDGFTEYTNNITHYSNTFPSICNMLTGEMYYWDYPADEYYYKAYENSPFLKDVKKQNYDIRLYLVKDYDYNDVEQLGGVVDNINTVTYEFRGRVAMVKLLKLSALRNAPMGVKPLLWMSSTEMLHAVSVHRNEHGQYQDNDIEFHEGLMEKRLRAAGDNSFIFYHMTGPHAPFNMNEKMQRVKKSNSLKQTKGSFNIVYDYMEQLKHMGLYRDATIIITGDHGVNGESPAEAKKPIVTGLFVKPAGAEGAPLAVNNAPVAPEHMRATVIASTGGKTDAYGDDYFTAPAKSAEPRTMLYVYDAHGDKDVEEYRITGDVKDFRNWDFVRNVPIKNRYITPWMKKPVGGKGPPKG